MATLVLGAVGAGIGAGFGGAVLGLSGQVIGGLIGSAVGSVVDSYILGGLMPDQTQQITGQRLESLKVTSSTEGVAIPRLFGRMRLGGNIIWATDFREETRVTTETQGGGGKGGGGGATVTTTTTEYLYYASFAVALCEGPIAGIGRVWADGDLLDMSGIAWRWYPGNEGQGADPLIAARMGAGAAPAYRGTAYVLFEDMLLTAFGNRIPQITFEVFRPLVDPQTIEGILPAVTLIPASGEFAYATEPVRRQVGSGFAVRSGVAENLNADPDVPDILLALDQLQAMLPAVQSVTLVVSWFGTDLRLGSCQLKPGVETASKETTPVSWSVNGLSRAEAHLVSQDAEGRPVYGGTPSDLSVVQAIQAIKARGLRVTFYPFILMDVPPGNSLPDPYSANAASIGQPAFPWRGRITCSPAAGFAGTVDKTAAAGAQVAAFMGSATAAQYSVSGTTVAFTGPPGEWSFRRMILHYAHLCAAAGGVDAFVIGTEMRGLTRVRSSATGFPAVAGLVSLLGQVRPVLGAGTKLGYAADWSEYFGYHGGDGTGDVFFNLDPLWSNGNLDFIGIDNYMPLSDWRDGAGHLDVLAGWSSIYDRKYLMANIAGGEGFDWFYASDAARAAQIRTPITDGTAGKPWVFRYKDLISWWSNPHVNRPGGVESGAPTAWLPQSKPIWFTELGCPAIDRGTNQPNVFVDPKSAESQRPYFSRGFRDDAIQRAYLEATYQHWMDPSKNPISSVYGGRMVHVSNCAAWTWDARPYPFFPERSNVWSDGENWRLGHWLPGRIGSGLGALVRALCLRAGLQEAQIDVGNLTGSVDGYVIGNLESARASLSMLGRHFGFDAVESEGVLRFLMRGRPALLTLTLDDLVAARDGEPFELTRGQETELPQALKWSVARADEDYDTAQVEARRITVASARIASESFPIAVAPDLAEQRCRRALMETWVGRERAAFRLPPSRLALDPLDVVSLHHDGRLMEFRLTGIADGTFRTVEATRQDQGSYDPVPGNRRGSVPATPALVGSAAVALLDLPQLRPDQAPHQPLIAAYADPWPGSLAVYRSATLDAFELATIIGARARIGTLAADLFAGPTSRFDLGNTMVLNLEGGTLDSVTDQLLFSGANAFALQSAEGRWEVLQAGIAQLVQPGRYHLTRLLRGQRGTETAIRNPAPAGTPVVILDGALVPLGVAETEIGMPWNWRIGPASRAVSDTSYVAQTFTPTGQGLVPFAPVHVEQPWRRARLPGDLTIRWTRRSRALVADAWEQVEVPLAEEGESYDVQILDGATIKRTLSSSTTSVLYTAAQQSTDWGAPLGPGQVLAIRIYQLSNRLGRGTPAVVTLQF
jgi:hypothetical protein